MSQGSGIKVHRVLSVICSLNQHQARLFLPKHRPFRLLYKRKQLIVPQPHRRRLQRPADFTGQPLSRFQDVFVRHGLPGLLLGVLFLLVPGALTLLSEALASGANNPQLYLVVASLLLGCFGYSWFLNRRWVTAHLGWILYLGLLCVWEEWVFRLALPAFLEGVGLSVLTAMVMSNVVFGAAHYFTLRWRWQWCVGAFIGGMMFSRQFESQGDLLVIIGIHWVATFLNTPKPPGRSTAANT